MLNEQHVKGWALFTYRSTQRVNRRWGGAGRGSAGFPERGISRLQAGRPTGAVFLTIA